MKTAEIVTVNGIEIKCTQMPGGLFIPDYKYQDDISPINHFKYISASYAKSKPDDKKWKVEFKKPVAKALLKSHLGWFKTREEAIAFIKEKEFKLFFVINS